MAECCLFSFLFDKCIVIYPAPHLWYRTILSIPQIPSAWPFQGNPSIHPNLWQPLIFPLSLQLMPFPEHQINGNTWYVAFGSGSLELAKSICDFACSHTSLSHSWVAGIIRIHRGLLTCPQVEGCTGGLGRLWMKLLETFCCEHVFISFG